MCPSYVFPSASRDTSTDPPPRHEPAPRVTYPKTHPAGLHHVPLVSIPLVRSRMCSTAKSAAVYPDASPSQGVQPQNLRISPRRAPVCWTGEEQHLPSFPVPRLWPQHGDVSMKGCTIPSCLPSSWEKEEGAGIYRSPLSGRWMAPSPRSKLGNCPVPGLFGSAAGNQLIPGKVH